MTDRRETLGDVFHDWLHSEDGRVADILGRMAKGLDTCDTAVAKLDREKHLDRLARRIRFLDTQEADE